MKFYFIFKDRLNRSKDLDRKLKFEYFDKKKVKYQNKFKIFAQIQCVSIRPFMKININFIQ